MSNPPIVTVILPTYNRRQFLPAAIRSVCGQTFRDWQLLVVNDGGEDVSDVVASFGDSRVEWHDRPHLGKAAALNFGLSLVQSKYIAYMDDDDLLCPNHLAELVAAAERERAEFVYSDTWLVVLDPNGAETARVVENDTDVAFQDIRCYNRINHKQILHTKRLADEIGPYNERLRILIDYDYIRRLARAAAPFHVHKTTGEHFLRQASATPGDYASISGLWISAPEACGRSVAALFADDPAALSFVYKDALRLRGTTAQLDRTRSQLADFRAETAHWHAEAAHARAETASWHEKWADVRDVLEHRERRLRVVESSLSYRIGRLATAPLRLLSDVSARLRRRAKRPE